MESYMAADGERPLQQGEPEEAVSAAADSVVHEPEHEEDIKDDAGEWGARELRRVLFLDGKHGQPSSDALQVDCAGGSKILARRASKVWR
ncbi:hypothetical protein MCOR25_009711 [Pyricularia grisea]|nr:hypothetical protein MCOR25_009711 [Pyricularia grisea]